MIVEFDGFAFHRAAVTFRRDRTKRNRWIAAGYTTLNYTWSDVTGSPERVAGQVRAALVAEQVAR
ncbi:hypothetical protein ACPXB3_14235 [Gordonia sp. DT219]|uniref:hypothetical protein n=1 Tax=Gordonia sp. DT219 TaxID=3416658 RepID=UPI003CE97C06